jgi:S1-C subfamily serine protease
VTRLQAWAQSQPIRSRNLFALGAAVRPGDTPSYFYTLFRSPDGNLRAYVRAGGPAYVAGLRSNDTIETIDGQAWWLLGTYQSERLAYDVKPHAFAILRGGRPLEVQLAQPFAL